ncbi:hypothetical protein rtp34 [Escherichia phage Rtp]|uniref:Lipoprotein n=1 Tax=Escherichia phage Rtp TaxID=2994041 RepID=Q333F0_9CAUD|nr:hypothetical protein rtp34 [Escherichia phage Rtp]CAJ42238.1 hypothetical protein [Escherichia phage Rtp]
MKAIIAIMATLLLAGCNSDKVKTLNVDLTANECKNIVYNATVNNESFTHISFKYPDLKDAVMYVSHIECTKTVSNFTRGVVIERTATLAKVSKPSDASIEMVYTKLYSLEGFAKEVGEKLAYSRVVMK